MLFRSFSPVISPPTTTTVPVRITNDNSDANTKGRGKEGEPAREEAPAKKFVMEEPSTQEMEEILKIIKKSDFKIVEQLGHTPSKISMLSLLRCSEAHAKALISFLKTAHVPQETSAVQFTDCIANLTADNGLGFSDADLTEIGRAHV